MTVRFGGWGHLHLSCRQTLNEPGRPCGGSSSSSQSASCHPLPGAAPLGSLSFPALQHVNKPRVLALESPAGPEPVVLTRHLGCAPPQCPQSQTGLPLGSSVVFGDLIPF